MQTVKFSKLRLLGFKSFVEPTEFLIEDGLTGVVGPNGCGKSNLVEALRWVMGEASYKNMRASGMDDVIFSGSANRPARNTAEVALFLDNADRSAPAAFNDADELQVSRRIEREAGSLYRINGKEARAKDVQLLFADASTGARSPSMVGQGRIGELISAKPQARRALLEEAAGISGLHSRRHEAELRLRGAEHNLERLDDVVAQLETQLEGLKRQARQANRYRKVAADIRRVEALLLHLRWSAARQAEASAQSELTGQMTAVGERTEAHAKATTAQLEAAERLPALRDEEASAAAALQRLTIELAQIDEEAARLAGRRDELGRRVEQLDADIAREERRIGENDEALARLAQEEKELTAAADAGDPGAQDSQAALQAAADALAGSEHKLSEATAGHARQSARRQQLEQTLANLTRRRQQLAGEAEKAKAELASVEAQIETLAGGAGETGRIGELEAAVEAAEALMNQAEADAQAALAAENDARGPLTDAQAEVDRLKTEAATLARVLGRDGEDLFPAVIERIEVDPGYEVALGAALGEDLDVPADPSAPAHWLAMDAGAGDPPLPAGVTPLASVVRAPAELARRLAHIGIVEKAAGAELHKHLRSGQCLVSKEGDVWRWDGYRASCDAPTAAARKLAQKNRLAEIETLTDAAAKKVTQAQDRFNDLKTRSDQAAIASRQTGEAWRERQRELADAREEATRAERAAGQATSRRSALTEAIARIAGDDETAAGEHKVAQGELEQMPDLSKLETELAALKAQVADDRAEAARARAVVETMQRETAARGRRLEAIGAERESWNRRTEDARRQLGELKSRREEAGEELAAIETAPGQIEERRRALLDKVETADKARAQAADRLAEAESKLAAADRALNEAGDALAGAREQAARAEERVNAGVDRRTEIEARIRDELNCEPAQAAGLAELKEGADLPELAASETRLERLRAERERIGAVNLRAETEAEEITEQRDALVTERDDLIAAIKRLRTGISSLNREGRERLLVAFDEVNGHFGKLFAHLFSGGQARLQLIESDDPLEAGLEILARPPGKRPQTMTLLSGGEQALTALALIFAVFLTNPAPICVLDEVDAPLDDANVERFCNLMDEIAASGATRFVIITHNPITMSRVDRLFGVTMAEQGVSQMVSVDLQTAERLREAG